MVVTNAIYYVDNFTVGSGDIVRSIISGVALLSGPQVIGSYVNHGLVNGEIVNIQDTSSLTGNFQVGSNTENYFYLSGTTWVSGADVTGNLTRNGGYSWADAWRTMSGVTTTRLAGISGVTINFAKSEAPYLIGSATWYGVKSISGGGIDPVGNISASSNTTPISITISGHNFVTDDVIEILGHANNINANGVWKVIGSTVNCVLLSGAVATTSGINTGIYRNITPMSVVLDTPETLKIDDCESGWVSVSGAVVSHKSFNAAIGEVVQGNYSLKIAKSGISNSSLYAYKTITPNSYTGYQNVSFNMKLSLMGTYGIIGSNQWCVALCSDVSGTTPVDIIPIPALPTRSGLWIPMNIAKSGGGNLGSPINSIAIYSDNAAVDNSGLYFDNFIATKTGSLNLTSFISKNNLEQGGSHAWYGLRSIECDGTILVLASNQTIGVTSGLSQIKGYYGNSEKVLTYARKGITGSLLPGLSDSNYTTNTSGKLGFPIYYNGGWNTITGSQDGETFIDGQNGNGFGFLMQQTRIKLNNFSFCRFSNGLKLTAGSNEIVNIYNLNNNSDFGINLGASSCTSINYLGFINNNASGGIIISGVSSKLNVIGSINECNNNGTNVGFGGVVMAGVKNSIELINSVSNNKEGISYLSGTQNVISAIGSLDYNKSYAIYFNNQDNSYIGSIARITNGGNINIIFQSSTNDNVINYIGSIICPAGNTGINFNGCFNNKVNFARLSGCAIGDLGLNNMIRNTSIDNSSEVSISPSTIGKNIMLNSFSHDGVKDNDWVFFDLGTINKQSGTTFNGSGFAWKFAITGGSRDAYYPLSFPLANIAINSGTEVTVKAFVKKDSATNVVSKIYVSGGLINGIGSTISQTSAENTDWQTLTLNFTPSENAVAQVMAQTYYMSGNSNAYFSISGISQA
jgi:hypothetical protein